MSNISIILPDNSRCEVPQGSTGLDLAKSISNSLARNAVAIKANGKISDLSLPLKDNMQVAILTAKDKDALEVLRHSASHLMAQAVTSLFPEAKLAIGPSIEDGFYYDIDLPRPLTPDDLEKISVKMKELVKANLPIKRFELAEPKAVELLSSKHQDYKLELVEDIPEGEALSFYEQGDFVDLCEGPHLPSTGWVKAFQLLSIAGAYWRGSEKNKMLQRIYGTAFFSQEELDAYLHRIEEAKKRDHRKLGKQLSLFHMQDEAPGMVFWHPKGWTLWQEVEQYMRDKFRQYGYKEVRTPMVMDRVLWERSGHWENYHANMFTTVSENRDYAVKPMNCPGHIQIFNHELHSYRELPLRLAEFGSCHRNEPSGTLHGLMRVRGFTQDDAHIFCTEDQVQSEVSSFIIMLNEVYKDFGFDEVLVKLSTRPEKRVGSDDVWDKAEAGLAAALKQNNIEYELQPGEGAFYGPKIEFTLKDTIGRLWQCGTIQLDFNLPVRLGAEFVDEDNTRKNPVMLHRAILGSMERFLGILIEHHAGDFPLWLAPVQARILPIADRHLEYCEKVAQQLKERGIRAEIDTRKEKIGYKIREGELDKMPYMVICGDKEVENNALSVRKRKGEESSADIGGFIEMMLAEIAAKH